MNLDFYNLDVLEKELEKLPPLHRIAFAASICERMLPIYQTFSQQEGWGNSVVLIEALDEVWQILQGKPVDEPKIRQLIEDCGNAAPHSDYVMKSRYDFEAQLTCSAIRSTLEACSDCNSQHFIDVMEFVRDTINGFLISRKDDADPNWYKKSLQEQEEYVSSHALAKQEIAKEQEDLQRLKEVETLDREFLESLRTSFNNSGRSLIDLS